MCGIVVSGAPCSIRISLSRSTAMQSKSAIMRSISSHPLSRAVHLTRSANENCMPTASGVEDLGFARRWHRLFPSISRPIGGVYLVQERMTAHLSCHFRTLRLERLSFTRCRIETDASCPWCREVTKRPQGVRQRPFAKDCRAHQQPRVPSAQHRMISIRRGFKNRTRAVPSRLLAACFPLLPRRSA